MTKWPIKKRSEGVASAAPSTFEPVIIEIRKKHSYKKKPVRDGNKKATPGCAICNLPKAHYDHVGAPPSLNALGSGDRFLYQGIKSAYEEAIELALSISGLPKPLNAVYVQCKMGFPDQRGRDEGNFRFIPEKALGDVLQRLGYLDDDTFYPGPAKYRFDNIEGVYDKGNSWCQMMIFPS